MRSLDRALLLLWIVATAIVLGCLTLTRQPVALAAMLLVIGLPLIASAVRNRSNHGR